MDFKSKFAGTNVLINVGGDIIYNGDPKARAAYYKDRFAKLRRPG